MHEVDPACNEVECDDLLQAGVNFFHSARLVNAAKLDRRISPVCATLLFLQGFTRRIIIITGDDGEIYWSGYSACSVTFLRSWKALQKCLRSYAYVYNGSLLWSTLEYVSCNHAIFFFFDETFDETIDRLRLYASFDLATASFVNHWRLSRESCSLFNTWGFTSLKLIELVLPAREICRSIH